MPSPVMPFAPPHVESFEVLCKTSTVLGQLLIGSIGYATVMQRSRCTVSSETKHVVHLPAALLMVPCRLYVGQ